MLHALMTILIAALVTLFTVSAFAMSSSPSQQWSEIVRDELKKCPELNCSGLRVQLAEMSPASFAALSKESRAVIRSKMLELARDIWPDTILEGPYLVRFNIRLERDQIQMLVVDGHWVGYRVTYSDKAWNMDRCEPMTTPASKQDLNDCESGRIFDRGFVASDLSVAFRDPGTVPEFAPEL